jgi:RibD C-terminal domain
LGTSYLDAVILGRRSYDEWAEFWPGSDIQPFASFINAVPKYVATSTPLEREWTNSRVIDSGLVDFVRHLKNRAGGDIGLHGSISVTRTLLAADVVGELRLVIPLPAARCWSCWAAPRGPPRPQRGPRQSKQPRRPGGIPGLGWGDGGAPPGTRTPNRCLKRALLCQLS